MNAAVNYSQPQQPQQPHPILKLTQILIELIIRII